MSTIEEREAARVRRSGRRGAAAVTGLVSGLALAVVAADLAAVAARGTGAFAASVPVVGGLRPVDPVAAGRLLADLPSSAGAWVVVAVLAVVGAWLVRLALQPGGRRLLLAPEGAGPVVADRGVVADAVAQVASDAARLPREQVDVRLRRRSARVVVRPLNGVPVQTSDVEQALAPAARRWGTSRSLRARVRVAEHGTVAS